jgi:hypothetical protein
MESQQWLLSLKKFDPVVLQSDYGRSLRLCKIDHATPTQIHIGRQKFRRKDGGMVACHGYNRSYLVEPTTERLVAIRRENALSRLRFELWQNHDNATLFSVIDVLDAARPVDAVREDAR